jgi:hypothetical protein
LFIQQGVLLLCRVQAVFEGLSHVPTVGHQAELLQGKKRRISAEFTVTEMLATGSNG